MKIGADWCSGCIIMKPRWKEIEKENPWVSTEYFDYDKDQVKLEKLNLISELLPTFVFLDKSGKELERISGEIDKEKLLELINTYKDK